MAKKRISGIFTFLMIIASLLMVRISCLGASPLLTETALKQQSYTLTVADERGNIYDCNMLKFTNNESRYCAVVSPNPTVIDELKAMGTSLSREKLAELVSDNKPFIADIQKTQTQNANITICETKKRYNSSPLAVHTIGYINKDLKGVSGIEAAFDDFLIQNGHKISASCQVDGRGDFLAGKPVEIKDDGSADAGVVLTLDSNIQSVTEHASKNIQKGAVVVLDAKTAQIKAMASYPSFSPSDPSKAVGDEEGAPMINRALNDFSVGSVFKIVTASAALDNGVSPLRSYTCTGSIDVDGQVFHCHNKAGHGTLDMNGAFVNSCNPYFISLGEEIGAKTLRDKAISFGYGRQISLADGITAKAGTLPSADMGSGQLANFSFGQGVLTANPLQVAESVYAVINGGKIVAPSLVVGTTKDGVNITKQQEGAPIQATSKQTADKVYSFMVNAVQNTAAQPQTVTAGGKSGTAQSGKYQTKGENKYDGWFAGFFPADNPKYIAVVLMEDADSGTSDSGAVFAKIADQITALEN